MSKKIKTPSESWQDLKSGAPKPETPPEASRLEPLPPMSAPPAINFTTVQRKGYRVEYFFAEGGDVTYHFWPPRGMPDFPNPAFFLKVEEGFIEVLPERTAVEADAVTLDEVQAIERVTGKFPVPQEDQDVPKEQLTPLPTLYVRVKELGLRPLAERQLTTVLFDAIDRAIA